MYQLQILGYLLPKILTLLVFINLADLIPIPNKNTISTQNPKNYEYYLDEFLRLYYQSNIKDLTDQSARRNVKQLPLDQQTRDNTENKHMTAGKQLESDGDTYDWTLGVSEEDSQPIRRRGTEGIGVSSVKQSRLVNDSYDWLSDMLFEDQPMKTQRKTTEVFHVGRQEDYNDPDWMLDMPQGDQPIRGPGIGPMSSTDVEDDNVIEDGQQEDQKQGALLMSDVVPSVDVDYLIKMRKRAKDNWIQVLKQNILKQVGWANFTPSNDPQTGIGSSGIVRSSQVPQYVQTISNSGFNSNRNSTSIMDLLRSSTTGENGSQHGVQFDGLVTEKIRSYYPQCELPKGTDIDLWNDENILNLYYNFDVLDGNIQAASLRLYRLLNNSDMTDVNCQQEGTTNSNTEDEKILRVSAYWYLKPLKKQKAVKKRMCDSKVVSLRANWIELNVKLAMTNWIRGRNAGLAIVVEDQDGGLLKADDYFNGPSCQSGQSSTLKPIPSFILDALRQPYNPSTTNSGQPHSASASAHGLLGQDARAALAAHTSLRLPSLDIQTSDLVQHNKPTDAMSKVSSAPQDGILATVIDDADCDSAEMHDDARRDIGSEVMLRHTRHHHGQGREVGGFEGGVPEDGARKTERKVDPDPRSRMVATQIIYTNQQLLDLHREHQRRQQKQNIHNQNQDGSSTR